MILVGAVFIVTAVLKSHQLLTEPILSKTFWNSWVFSVIQVPLELGLGIWLISGLFRKTAHLIAMAAFGAFLCMTAYLGATGAQSCGCFGKVHVNPWITFSLIDLPLFLALTIFQVKDEKFFPPPWPGKKHFFSVAIPTVILIVAVTFTLAMNKQEREESQDPSKWVNSTNGQLQGSENGTVEFWSWLDKIDVGDQISSGMVIVLLYRHDCPDCHEAIPVYNEMALELGVGQEDADIQMAFIEIPPYGEGEEDLIPQDSPCIRGKIDQTVQWLVETPVIVVLNDGEVLRAWEGNAPTQEEIFQAIFTQ